MSIKNSSDIGNRTRDLMACKAVPQPTAPLRAPYVDGVDQERTKAGYTELPID